MYAITVTRPVQSAIYVTLDDLHGSMLKPKLLVEFSFLPFKYFVDHFNFQNCCFVIIFDRNKLRCTINLLKPTGHVMHQQFNIQQLYVLPTLYLCVLYLSENRHRLVPLTP